MPIAQRDASTCATCTPGTMRSASGILAKPPRRGASDPATPLHAPEIKRERDYVDQPIGSREQTRPSADQARWLETETTSPVMYDE